MKIVQINAVYAYSSTGRTTTELHNFLSSQGHESHVFCYNTSDRDKHVYRMTSSVECMIHSIMSRITGLQGYFSYFATLRMLRKLNKIHPDIVHLRNLHGNYIHVPMLLKYLAQKDIATVITLHDMWFLTGHCFYPNRYNCQKFTNVCHQCPAYHDGNHSWFFDTSRKSHHDKISLLKRIPRLKIIGNSKWTTGLAKSTKLYDGVNTELIYNWIDLEVFHQKPNNNIRQRLNLSENDFVILGVAQSWTIIKGLRLFLDIAQADPTLKILLVGNIKDIHNLPKNVICAGPTNSATELADFYSAADVFVNASTMETFGKVSAEAIACGTPIVTNQLTANPEIAEEGCGIIAEKLTAGAYLAAIQTIRSNGKHYYSDTCTASANKRFAKNKNISLYIELYHRLCK